MTKNVESKGEGGEKESNTYKVDSENKSEGDGDVTPLMVNHHHHYPKFR